MVNELEKKIRLQSNAIAQELVERCQSLSKAKGDYSQQRDEYYDLENHQLAAQDYTVRLRIIGDDVLLALKGPRTFQNEAYQRIELEFSVKDEEEARRELSERGLRPITIIEKRRWSFQIREANIVIDELPFIGFFCEIEADNQKSIARMITLLDLSEAPFETKNYTELLLSEGHGDLESRSVSATFIK